MKEVKLVQHFIKKNGDKFVENKSNNEKHYFAVKESPPTDTPSSNNNCKSFNELEGNNKKVWLPKKNCTKCFVFFIFLIGH